MKIAVTGKGGVGKTTICALLAKRFADEGQKVIAVDADPDSDLAMTIGVPEEIRKSIVPISQMKELIEERTGVKPGTWGAVFKLNPKVDDLVDRCGITYNGLRLLTMGGLKSAGEGCYCAENTLLKKLMSHLILRSKEKVLLDMEAGIEHLTRGTAESMDVLLVVVEPGKTSIKTALTISELATDIGIEQIIAIGNKIRNDQEIQFLISSLPSIPILGFLSFSQEVIDAGLGGKAIIDSDDPVLRSEINDIWEKLTAKEKCLQK